MKYQFDYRAKNSANNWITYGAKFYSLNEAYSYLAMNLNKINYEWQLMEIDSGERRRA